jgi:hypothetical protein
MRQKNLPRRVLVKLGQGFHMPFATPSDVAKDHVGVWGHWPTNSALGRGIEIFNDLTNMTTQ